MSDILTETILQALESVEAEGDLVIATSVPRKIAVKIQDRIANEVPIPPVSQLEFTAIRSLIYHATNDTRFFDTEMPALTGLTKEEFEELARRLPIK